MNNSLSKRTRDAAIKTAAILTAITTVMSLMGFALSLAPNVASAAKPSDYGLREGDTVSAAGSDDPDVYIVNEPGYKRLFLNPAIFLFYGHLGGFAAVHNVSATTRDAFPTSGLFRNCEVGSVNNDGKVYGVETTGEDTGILHWVNTSGAQAVADDPNFFNKVFCINDNEFNWYAKGTNYTSVSQVPNYVRVPGATATPVAGNLSVSLASDNPGATTVTTNAQGVNYLKFNLSGSGTINTITVKRGGAGSVNDFDNVYLYEGAKRLVDGKSLSSSTGEATFNMGSFVVSGTRTLTVVGDLSATAGNVNSFQVNAIALTSGTVSGLPVSGNNLAVSGATSGTLTQTKVGSIPNPNAGAANSQMSEFKLAANTEAASIKRMQMIQGGSVKPADLTNLKLKTGTTEWAGTMDSAGRVVFDMGSGYTIAKGGSAIFKVYGDVAGKKAETIALYFESVTDILAIGDQYGFGVAVTLDAAMDDATAPPLLTLQGGILTASYVGPTATNIGTNTDDTDFLDFNLAAASNIEIKKTRLNISLDLTGNAAWEDLGAASLSSGFSDLDDIKIINRDTGTVVCGPVDGSSFIVDEAAGNPDSNSAAQYAFTDAFDMTTGQTLHLRVTADYKQANTRTGTDIETGSKFLIGLASYADDLGVTEKKYTGTTTALAAADIVPNANINGPTFTVVSAALTLTLAANPADTTAVKGTQNVDVVGITFTASNASKLVVTDITLTGYSSDSATADGWDIGSAADGDIGSMVSSVAIYEKETGILISSTPSANNIAATAGTVTFNNLSWNIPAGGSKTLLVKANLLNLSAPTSHYFSFDINAATDVTATDESGNTINGSADPNGGPDITTGVNFTDSGHIFVTEDQGSPSKSKNSVYWGQTGVIASQFRLRTTNEGFLVDKMTIDATGDATDAKNNVKNVYLEYKNKDGVTLTSSAQALDTNASTSFSFSGDNRPYVPQDSYAIVSVKMDTIATYAAGATSGVNFGLDFEGDKTTYFEATGAGSLTKIYGLDSTADSTIDVDSTNKMFVYRAYPKITAVSMPDGSTSGSSVVGKFDITAMGLAGSAEVLFSTINAASGTLTFDTLSSGSLSQAAATLYDDAAGTILDTSTLGSAANNASLSFASFDANFSILAGQTKRIRVEANLSTFNDPVNNTSGLGADYFQLIWQDQANVILWTDGAGAETIGDAANTAGYTKNLPAVGPYLTAH